MVVDRVERHDVVNAVMLAGVLLLLGFGIVTAFQSLFDTLDDGVVRTEKAAVLESEAAAPNAEQDPAVVDETPTTLVPARAADTVIVRVANGARRAGVAGAGTEVVQGAGYPTLAPKNGPTLDDSVVYYENGYAADAVQIAELLGLRATQIEPMPSDPGVPIEDANIIAILGVNSGY